MGLLNFHIGSECNNVQLLREKFPYSRSFDKELLLPENIM